MPTIEPERLEKYRRLADKNLWDLKDPKAQALYTRVLKEGLEPVNPDISQVGMWLAPYSKGLDNLDIAIVGVPMDIGVPIPRPGTRLAPMAVREWSLYKDIINFPTGVMPYEICNIADWGDIDFSGEQSSVEAYIEKIFAVYAEFRKSNTVTFSIGGEHTATYPILKALGQNRPLGLIHLDAHGDTCSNFGGTRISDSSQIQLAVTDGVVDPEKSIQIGLRGRGIVRCEFSYETGMRVVLAEEFFEKGLPAIIQEARRVVGDGPCYLTIDTDVLDCSDMPGTTHPEPFGLSGREVRDFIRGLSGLNLVGADIMELNPPGDPTQKSVYLVAGLGFEILCILAESRARQNGIENKTHWDLGS